MRKGSSPISAKVIRMAAVRGGITDLMEQDLMGTGQMADMAALEILILKISLAFGRRTYQAPKAASDPGDSADIRQAVDLINIGEYARATETLNTILSDQRDARWYYLSALANFGLGNQLMAMEQIRKAIEKDPGNVLYRQTLQTFQGSASAYEQQGREFQAVCHEPE